MPHEKHARYVLLAQLSRDMVSGHGVSHSQKNHIRDVSTSSVPSVFHPVTETLISWKTLQTAFIPHRQSAEAAYTIERCTELAREWSIPVFIAQPELMKAFDRISHESMAEVLSRKNLSPQLVAVLCSWWCCSFYLEVRLGHVTSDHCVSVDRGVVMVADEILDGLRLSCLGYADDVLLFSWSKASLEAMVEDCFKNFGEKWFWTKLTGAVLSRWMVRLVVWGQSIVWERKLEFIGSVIEPGAHSGGAVRHRSQKASSVFYQWKPSCATRSCRSRSE